MDLPEDIWFTIYQDVHKMNMKEVQDEFVKKNEERFNFIMSDLKKCSWRNDLKNAYNFISDENLWEIIKIDPPPSLGYLFWDKVDDIRHYMNIDVGVFTAVMYNMNFIAKHGFTKYRKTYPNVYT